MPNYRVTDVSGLREKIIVARDEDQARELWGGDLRLLDAADRLGLTVEAYRETILVEEIKPYPSRSAFWNQRFVLRPARPLELTPPRRIGKA